MQHLIFPNRLASRTFPPSAKLSESLQKVLNKLPKEPQLLYENLPIHPPPAATDPNAAHKLHELLKELDPEVAARWHWKDTRKVLRSLNIIKETGRRPSEIMENQSHKSPESEPRCARALPSISFYCIGLWHVLVTIAFAFGYMQNHQY